jgi:hypothetical protein
MLYGRDIDCNLLFWPGYYTNAEPSGPNDDQGRGTCSGLQTSARQPANIADSGPDYLTISRAPGPHCSANSLQTSALAQIICQRSNAGEAGPIRPATRPRAAAHAAPGFAPVRAVRAGRPRTSSRVTSRHLTVGKPSAEVFRLMMVYDMVFRTLLGRFRDRISIHLCIVGKQLISDISRHA